MKVRTQGECVLKPKSLKEKDAQKREGHRRMTEERDTKTENTFSICRRKTQDHY